MSQLLGKRCHWKEVLCVYVDECEGVDVCINQNVLKEERRNNQGGLDEQEK